MTAELTAIRLSLGISLLYFGSSLRREFLFPLASGSRIIVFATDHICTQNVKVN